jgi:hypothetical protein
MVAVSKHDHGSKPWLSIRSRIPSELIGRIVAERNAARKRPKYPSEMRSIKKGPTKPALQRYKFR